MIKKIVLSALISTVLMACAATPPTNFYVLESLHSPVPVAQSATTKRVIGLGPISLPSLLNRNQIVTRNTNNSVQLAEFDQWAAPLTEGIKQVLQQNLTALCPEDIFRDYPWSQYGDVGYHVIIDITRFDAELAKTAYLEGSFAIMNDKDHAIVYNGKIKMTQALSDESYAGVVKALGKLLGDFSQQLALAVEQIK